MDLLADPSFTIIFLFLVFALLLLLFWMVYTGKKIRHKKPVKYACLKCGSEKLTMLEADGPCFQCDACGAKFGDPIELFSLDQSENNEDSDEDLKKRICPNCGSGEIYPDQVAGSLITWTCKKCGSTFPSAIEIYEKK